MSYANRRLEQAARARDERQGLAWLKAHPAATCPSCGRPLETVLPGSGVLGRNRIWCSNACRQRAYRARKAGDGAAPNAQTQGHSPAPTQTAAPPAPTESPPPTAVTPNLDECIVTVLQSPTAVATVLDVVRRALRDGALDQPEYTDVQVALLALRDEMNAGNDRPVVGTDCGRCPM